MLKKVFKFASALTVAVSMFHGITAVGRAQTRVQINTGRDDAPGTSIVVSTLAGVGVMLAAANGDRASDLEVVLDEDTNTYIVRNTRKGNAVYVELDESGRYEVHLKKGKESRAIEHSLSGASVVVRSRDGGVELSEEQVHAMAESWRRYGMNEGEVQVNLRGLESLGVALEDMGYALDEMGRSLDEMGRRLEESLGSGAGVEPSSPPPRGRHATTGDEIRCGSTDELRIENQTILVDGIAIDAQGMCEIYIIDSEIVSRQDVAIVLSGSAEIHIINSRIEGRRGAVGATGMAEIEARNTEFYGPLNTSSRAEFVDNGGNTFHR